MKEFVDAFAWDYLDMKFMPKVSFGTPFLLSPLRSHFAIN